MRNTDGAIASGTVEFKPGRFEGGGMVYLRFRAWLQEVDETAGGIGAVYFEEVRFHRGVTAAHAYGGYLAQPMIGPAGYRSCLARAQARTAPSDEDLLAMRRAAWRTQGVVVLRPEDVRDDWTRQALINEANRLYGRRPGGHR